MHVTDRQVKERLSPDQYRVVAEKGTEAPFSGEYLHHTERGMYRCVVCGAELFSSKTKFDSGTGWPSFDEPANREHVELVPDLGGGMRRTEVRCRACGAHLGHLFDDGPTQTGKRYCINSCALRFEKKR